MVVQALLLIQRNIKDDINADMKGKTRKIMYNETIMILTILTLIVAPTTTIIVAIVNTKTVNKKLLEAQTDSEKQKKVANIYYERRAESLLGLYSSISLEYNSIYNLLFWILKLQTDEFARPEEIHKSYLELLSKNNELCKDALQSKIFLNEKSYDNIYNFVSRSQEYVSVIVDCFEAYKNISSDLNEKDNANYEKQRINFIQEVALKEVSVKFQLWENEVTQDLNKIKNEIKEVLKSQEIL